MEIQSNTQYPLAVKLVNANADPLVFEFRRGYFQDAPAHVCISRLGWHALNPSQAIGYVVDRYLLEHPEEEQRVGRGLVAGCVQKALDIPS